MSFCCGASMIGTIGSIQTERVHVSELPIVYCPVCKGIEIHPRIEDQFHILIEFAEGDRAKSIVFTDFVDLDKIKDLKDVCSSWDTGDHERLIQEQIDHGLDLFSIAKKIGDTEWELELKKRLQFLSSWSIHWQKYKDQNTSI